MFSELFVPSYSANLEVLELDLKRLRGEDEASLPDELVSCCSELQSRPQLLRSLVDGMAGSSLVPC